MMGVAVSVAGTAVASVVGTAVASGAVRVGEAGVSVGEAGELGMPVAGIAGKSALPHAARNWPRVREPTPAALNLIKSRRDNLAMAHLTLSINPILAGINELASGHWTL
jgi:hypothetical protein